ncbi:MAG: hypothetical protein EXS09_20720 [Gemmataceae bacterium]|nr:hypothetical protein [Gemmataceae bacterium]
MSQNQEKGDCFPAEFNHLLKVGITDLDGKQFVLVHGNLADLPQDEEVNHAWVEEGEIVHEVSNGQDLRLPKAAYYAQFKVTKTRRYSVMEAMRNGAEKMGPWDQ